MNKPKYYLERDERLVKMHSRVDLRKIASLVHFLDAKFGIVCNNKSEVLRKLTDLLFRIVEHKPETHIFDSHKDAIDFLAKNGITWNSETQEAEAFDRVLGSESFDVEHGGQMMSTSENSKETNMWLDTLAEIEQKLRAEGKAEEVIKDKLKESAKSFGITFSDYLTHRGFGPKQSELDVVKNVTGSDKEYDQDRGNHDDKQQEEDEDTELKPGEETKGKGGTVGFAGDILPDVDE